MRAVSFRWPGRDWKGDPIPSNPFAPPVHVPIPPELVSKAALLAHWGMNERELKKIRWYRRKMYHVFELEKSGGKRRRILAPDKRLKHLQRRILPLLNQLYRVRNPVHGFVSGKSVKTNAAAHLRRRNILNVDVQDFFGTITENRVVGVLEAIGVSHDVASTIGVVCCCEGALPQGAPTSPVLSNMICFRLDRELMHFAKSARCIYTRYADDITFSSHQPITAAFESAIPPSGNFKLELLSSQLLEIFTANGFTLNPSKVHYADRNSRRTVTGLKVNELLNVDRRFVRNLRAKLHSFEKLGPIDAQQRFIDLGNSGSLAQHIRGKIEWLVNVKGAYDPVVRSIIARHNICLPSQAIPIEPTMEERRERAIWVTESDNEQGSVFFLKDVGLVTAAHCLDGQGHIEIFHPANHANTFAATVAHVDNARDLAILSHDIPVTEYFELDLGVRAPAVGDKVNALGYPSWGFGDPLNIRPGVVSTLTKKADVRLIEVTQKLAQGMSGGPVTNESGEVVGIIHKGGPQEGRDFAIDARELQQLTNVCQ